MTPTTRAEANVSRVTLIYLRKCRAARVHTMSKKMRAEIARILAPVIARVPGVVG